MRKPLKTIVWGVVFAAFACLLAGYLAKDAVLRGAAEAVVEEATGFDADLAGAEIQILGRTADFRGLRLYNPTEFPEREAIAVDRVYIETTWRSLWSGAPWFKKLHIDVPRVQVVRPRTGPSNFEILAENIESWQRSSTPAEARRLPSVSRVTFAGWGARIDGPAAKSPAGTASAAMRIDELRIRLGRITIVDHRLGRSAPVTIARDVDRERVYRDITDMQTLAEDLSVDFAVDALVGGFEGLTDMAPALADGIKSWMRRSKASSESESARPVKDAAAMFEDLLNDTPK